MDALPTSSAVIWKIRHSREIVGAERWVEAKTDINSPGQQLAFLLILSACPTWMVTHEKVLSELREWLQFNSPLQRFSETESPFSDQR
jgi:iron only hydrogenase large subunit-like protein